MEFRQMRHFVAVAEELHFGRAALRLGIVQPALTKSIQRLEESLGIQLLSREHHRVELTAGGAVFVKQARELLALGKRTESMVREPLASNEAQELRIGAVASAQFWLTPRVVDAFCRAFPRVRVSVKEGTTSTQLQWLQSGAVDITFSYAPLGEPKISALRMQPLARPEMFVAVRKGSRFSKVDEIELKQLAGESFVSFTRDSDPALYDAFTSACEQAGFAPRIVYETSSLLAELSLVSRGIGVALMNRMACFVPIQGVTMVPLVGMPSHVDRDFVAAWKPRCESTMIDALVTQAAAFATQYVH